MEGWDATLVDIRGFTVNKVENGVLPNEASLLGERRTPRWSGAYEWEQVDRFSGMDG